MFLKPLYKRLVQKIKSWYDKYQDWKYGIESPNYYYRKLKLGEILKDGDILYEGAESIPLIIGNPRCKNLIAGTLIDNYLLSFKPTRKEFINGTKDI